MKRILHIVLLLIFMSYSAFGQVKYYKAKVIKSYPHDTKAYTQGLFFHNGILYESTGLNGKSSLRQVKLETGEIIQKENIPSKYFVEGSVVLNDKLFVLTWTSKVLFIYDPVSLKKVATKSYPREGWGLTTDGKNLIVSDGSSRLYFLSPELKTLRSINVTLNGKAVNYLNELEWIDGKIWANIYTSNFIAIINPSTGVVEGMIDCNGLLPKSEQGPDTDVLNGIAIDENGSIYLTGKNWPKIYQIKLVDKN